MHDEYFYHLMPHTDSLDTSWQEDERVKKQYKCSCGKPIKIQAPVDLHVQFTNKEINRCKPYSGIYGGIDAVYNDFFENVPPEILARDTFRGTLFNEDNEPTPRWSTISYRKYLYIRTDKKHSLYHGLCSDCGLPKCTAIGGDWYLYPSPPADTDIFGGLGLIVRPHIFELLNIHRWKTRFYITRLPVLEQPLDGLDLPPYYPFP